MRITRLIVFLSLSISSILFAAETTVAQLVIGESKCVFGDEFECVFEQLPKGFYYPRDYSFPLKHSGGKQYIPKNLTRDQFESMALSQNLMLLGYYLDEYGFDVIKEKPALIEAGGFGSDGFVDRKESLIAYFKEHNISYKEPGHTIIEGGNIHLVMGAEKTKAIVGDHSVIATYIGMSLNNSWPLKEIARIVASNTEASSLHYYVERNANLLMQYIMKVIPADNWQHDATKKMTGVEKRLLEMAARIVSARLQWCKQQIVKELELNAHDVIFLPQRSYHLDLDLLITAKGAIALRPARSDAEEGIWALQRNILSQHFALAEVPGHLADPYMFCGLNVQSKNWYLFPSTTPAIAAEFSKFLEEEGGFQLGIPISGGQLFQEKLMGFHCLTQEYYKDPSPKQDCQPNLKACATCNKTGQLLKCSRCHDIFYCNKACQSEHWPTHRLICKQK